MLQTFHKAFVRNVFTPENKPPIELKDLEIYLQILYPVYQFSFVDGDFKLLCSYIIAALNYKFNYELNTNYYCVAALLNISKLHNWASRVADCSFIIETAFEKISKQPKYLFLKNRKAA